MRAPTIELIERLIEIMSQSKAKHSDLHVRRENSRQRLQPPIALRGRVPTTSRPLNFDRRTFE